MLKSTAFSCLLVLVVCAPATSQAQDMPAPDPFNAQLPEWVRVTAATRLRVENEHLLERLRVGTRITPLERLQLVAEVQDSRAWNFAQADGSVRDVLDIRQAWVGIGRDKDWLDLKVGRQKLAYGSERVIGGAEWGNTARVFDAARLGIHHGGSRVDVFASAVVTNEPESPDHHQKGHTLTGAYGSLTTLLPGASVEPYVLVRHLPTAVGEGGLRGSARSDAVGTRVAGRIGSGWSYEGELVGQRGHVARSDLHAWAGLAQVQRHFASLAWSPTLLAEANYASGDSNPADGVVETFDQLYPTNHSIYGVADRVGRRNQQNGRVGLWVRPKTGLVLKAEGNAFWLADSHDALYAASGAVSVPRVAGGATSTHVGNELDFIADYHLSRHYDVGAQFGHMFRGSFLRTYDTAVRHSFYCVFVDVHL